MKIHRRHFFKHLVYAGLVLPATFSIMTRSQKNQGDNRRFARIYPIGDDCIEIDGWILRKSDLA